MGRTKWGLSPEMSMMVGQEWRPSGDAAPSPAPLTPPASCQTTASTTTSVASGVGVWEGDCSSSGSSSPGVMSSLLAGPPWYARPPESPPDQPLDLSAKPRQPASPGPSQPALKLPPLPKHIFKAKPRLSAVTGRKTYTEDELQAALRDIQSGKLGTRRAAVIYGIPRSTLRNKVYKLTQERRDVAKDEDDEEEDLSPDEEEKEVEKVLRKPLLTLEDVIRVTGGKALEALPYLQQVLQGEKEVPELVRSMMAEERQIRQNGDILKVPTFVRTSPPASPAKPRPAQASQAEPVPRNFNNNEEKKAQQGPSKNQSGKGTRPKRGKYRNYDRDSLVEAVRAVQRGEMSVHRAGSYYGVPHSTLEYKVKERHLMRPRKREPKVQTSIQEEVKRKEEAEKRAAARPRFQVAPNGMKLPLFDPLTYPGAPYPFWPAPPFTPLPLADYPRPEIFPGPMIQRLQEASTSSLAKTTRDLAESLYDGTGENGSFLDGIIRSSLETGLPPKDGPKAALLEQLCRGQTLAEPPVPPATSPPHTPSACDES